MAVDTQTCYRHTDRETGVSCSNCGRPICTECMTSTPVGMRCPECSRQKTQVRSLASLTPEPDLTKVLIGISVVVFLADALAGGGLRGSGLLADRGFLFGPLVAEGEWWRLITSGFLHSGPFHILLNMVALWFLGNLLEPSLGRVRFGLLYFVSLFGGALGVMLLSPEQGTVGASGAIFGLLGAALVIARSRRIDIMASGLGPILLLNLVITFAIPGISIGGHLGGLALGALSAVVLSALGDRRATEKLAYAACAALGVAAALAAIVAANTPALYPAF